MAAKKSSAKTTTKGTPAKTTGAARKMTAIQKPMTKSAMIEEIAQNTGLNKTEVSSVFDELAVLIERHVKKRSTGQFTLPGLMKVEVKKKPASKAREGINPRTGEKITIPAKPARRAVRIKPLKKLKEMIG
ncbi:MAG: HU family DNA-binding protein [Deltaproteobacteria bacterium]|nr:HU family DNA-binding protein [Deltaproteobacteria bacterium]MCF8119843.1 HU family DNA-binding protein [Deltaproteobacteria bacterium]